MEHICDTLVTFVCPTQHISPVEIRPDRDITEVTGLYAQMLVTVYHDY